MTWIGIGSDGKSYGLRLPYDIANAVSGFPVFKNTPIRPYGTELLPSLIIERFRGPPEAISVPRLVGNKCGQTQPLGCGTDVH
jgi:hypothetical protein